MPGSSEPWYQYRCGGNKYFRNRSCNNDAKSILSFFDHGPYSYAIEGLSFAGRRKRIMQIVFIINGPVFAAIGAFIQWVGFGFVSKRERSKMELEISA